MRIEDILKESCIIADIGAKTKREALSELVGVLKKEHLIGNTEEAVGVILEREKLGSTGIGDGVAIPHGKMKNLPGILCVFGRSRKGIDFDAMDSKPVHIFFLLLAPEGSASLHLKVLSRISKILRDSSFRQKLMELPDAKAIYTNIVEEDSKI